MYVSYRVIDHESVEVFWNKVTGAIGYDIRFHDDRSLFIESTSYTVRGLNPKVTYDVRVKPVFAYNYDIEWSVIQIQSQYLYKYPAYREYYSIGPIINTRYAFSMSLPDNELKFYGCTLNFWWQPSDKGWWASFEKPNNTFVVGSKRMGLNCGLFDDLQGVILGNIVIRSTSALSTEEPKIDSFIEKTHDLRWEPQR